MLNILLKGTVENCFPKLVTPVGGVTEVKEPTQHRPLVLEHGTSKTKNK